MVEIIKSLPSPLEVMLDPISLIILGLYGFLMLWEALFPARVLPRVKYWKVKGIVAFLGFFYLSTYFPLVWDTYLVKFQLFDLSILGTYLGALVGFVVYQFGMYIWHRSMHSSDRLWKIFHQMHHSTERMDSFSAFYFSPADILGFSLIGSICLVLIAGFTAEATTLIILTTTFFAIFQHSNIRTPVWMGYIIQRPESHVLHHAKGIHAYNYCDLSLIDMIFGTFKNPKYPARETGFYNGASNKVTEMLLFKDISEEN